MSIRTGLISYWKCDEASGNAFDSLNRNTLTNNGTTTYAAAKINNGFDFGSANSTKYFNNTSRIYKGGAFSYSFWINIQTAPSSGNTATIFVANDHTTDTFAFMEYRNVAGTLKVAQGRSRFNVGNDEILTTQTLTVGTWFHLVCTYDGTTVTSYINNVSKGTTTSSGNGNTGVTNELSVGRWVGASNYVSAYIDEIGFWDKALTVSEVDILYNSGNGLSYPFKSGNIKVLRPRAFGPGLAR